MEDIYQTFHAAQHGDQLKGAMQELNDMNPPPMNTMLEKQSREEAMKRTERKGKSVQDVPPTAPGKYFWSLDRCRIFSQYFSFESIIKLMSDHTTMLFKLQILWPSSNHRRLKDPATAPHASSL